MALGEPCSLSIYEVNKNVMQLAAVATWPPEQQRNKEKNQSKGLLKWNGADGGNGRPLGPRLRGRMLPWLDRQNSIPYPGR
jgi:hypothetical protein